MFNKSQNDSLSALLNTTILTTDDKSQMRDYFRLNPQNLSQNYQNDMSLMMSAKDSTNVGIYPSSIQLERSTQYDMVMAQRRHLFQQEQELVDKINNLKETNKRYNESKQHYGVQNANLETEIKKKFEQIQVKANEISMYKAQVMSNFESIQKSQVSSKSKFSTIAQIALEKDPSLRLLNDKLDQDKARIEWMKKQYAKGTEIIPFDKKIQDMQEETFEKQARLLYNGTKFEGNENQKLAALSTLRRKIEEFTSKKGLQGVILQMPFKLDLGSDQIENMHKSEYQSTLQELEQLKSNYIQSGGTDPNYLISLNNLETYYKQNHIIGEVEHGEDDKDVVEKNKLKMNLNKRGPITNQPIFEFLPESLQQDIYELENSVNMQREADLVNPVTNKEIMRQPFDVQDSSKADANMLEHLRQQEADMIMTNNKEKFQEIQQLKAIYEKRYLEKRVQEELASKSLEDEVLNQRSRPQDKLNYLKFIQSEINTIPLFYDPDSGFVIRIDYINQLPICYDYVKVAYGIFTKDAQDIPVTEQATLIHQTVPEGIHSNKCLLLERFLQRDIKVYKFTFLYLYVYGYSQQFGGGLIPMDIGWSLHQLFDQENLIQGFFELPLYNTTFDLELSKIAPVDSVSLGIRISMPGDIILDIDNKLINLNQYNRQEIHNKQLELIQQQSLFKFNPIRMVQKWPEEYLQMPSNNFKIYRSQLPPNQYKLNNYDFVTDDQKLQAKILSDMADREIQRGAGRFRRRQNRSNSKGTPQNAQPTDRISFKDRMKARMMNKEKTANTPKQDDTGRQSSRIGTRTPAARQRTEQTPQENLKKSSFMQSGLLQQNTQDMYLVFKLRQLAQIYTSNISNLVLKIALFSQSKLIEDDNKKPCIFKQVLTPDEKGDNYYKYNVDCRFEFNLNEFFKEEEEEDILGTYLFITFFKENDSLYGWQAIQVFENVEGNYRVKSGVYYENLYQPPGQTPPFKLAKVKKLNANLKFILMNNNEKENQLKENDNYRLDQKLQTEEDIQVKKKIYHVDNPSWSTQIKIEIQNLKNFPSKNDLVIKLAILNEAEIIPDYLERLCIRIDKIELFEGMGRNEFIANHIMILRVGTKYLYEIFRSATKKLTYVLTYYYGQDILGMSQLQVYNTRVQQGQFKLFVHEINKDGQMGKKTNKEINIYITEELLDLKDVEATPTYAKQAKDKKQVATTDKSKVLIVDIDILTDYPKQDPITEITVQIYRAGEVAVDLDGVICAKTIEKDFVPKAGEVKIRDQVYFKMPINSIIETDPTLDDYLVFISFGTFGWVSTELFAEKQLNQYEKFDKLYIGNVMSPPFNFSNLKRMNTKLKYQLTYDLKPQTEQDIMHSQVSQNNQSKPQITLPVQQNSSQQLDPRTLMKADTIGSRRKMPEQKQDKLIIRLLNINGFNDNATYYTTTLILSEGQSLKDRSGQSKLFQSQKYQNNNKLIYLQNEVYEIDIDIKKIPFSTFLVIKLQNQNGELVAWFYKPLMKAAGILDSGQFNENLFKPPAIKPPVDLKQVNLMLQTIQYTIN